MYHSITIGDKNTWDDWHLVPTSRPVVNPPKARTKYIEVPGADGFIDLSDMLTGQVLYDNREGSWEFIVQPGQMLWSKVYSEIMQYIHGNFLKIILEDDPDFYYEGRLFVNQWLSDKNESKITIGYNLAPYKKYSLESRTWIWDTFNFETDIIREYKDMLVDGKLIVNVVGEKMASIPTIISSSDITLIFNGKEYSLKKGMNRNENIVIHDGKNPMTFLGYAKVSIDFIGGIL